MKPDWDKLMKAYADNKEALVGDVDCTEAGKDLCETHGVQGFPTIKWGDPSDLQDYDGGRELKDLKKFADENLKPQCSPKNLELCDDDKKKQISDIMAFSTADLEAKIEEKVKLQSDTEDNFKEEVDKLQKRYEFLEKDKKEKLEEIKNSGLGLMKAVMATKKGSKEEL